jgi:hypothetical protein
MSPFSVFRKSLLRTLGKALSLGEASLLGLIIKLVRVDQHVVEAVAVTREGANLSLRPGSALLGCLLHHNGRLHQNGWLTKD